VRYILDFAFIQDAFKCLLNKVHAPTLSLDFARSYCVKILTYLLLISPAKIQLPFLFHVIVYLPFLNFNAVEMIVQ